MVLLSAQGMPVANIAEVSFTSDNRFRDVIHNFNADDFGSLHPKYSGGPLVAIGFSCCQVSAGARPCGLRVLSGRYPRNAEALPTRTKHAQTGSPAPPRTRAHTVSSEEEPSPGPHTDCTPTRCQPRMRFRASASSTRCAGVPRPAGSTTPPPTVKNVPHEINTRLQLRDRAHAVGSASRDGLI
ncbi:hypothetical protein [Streptomyces sp. NPDC056061]|uniref:hypothetical protein n=1 Tax=Streptomyces sp. NPDC056061 TaxID=3345700 RepID=UPI0035DBC94B